jgi:proteasome lid subunit RPN8/RPN11
VRAVAIDRSLIGEMRGYARVSYPDECCGFLVARPDPSSPERPRTIVEIRPAVNEVDAERRRRFLIRAGEVRSTERALEGTGRVLVGFYHSHPDHPARPSAFDQEHAWPWYTYIVLSVSATDAPKVGAFELDPVTSVFREVPLTVASAAVGTGGETLSAAGAR